MGDDHSGASGRIARLEPSILSPRRIALLLLMATASANASIRRHGPGYRSAQCTLFTLSLHHGPLRFHAWPSLCLVEAARRIRRWVARRRVCPGIRFQRVAHGHCSDVRAARFHIATADRAARAECVLARGCSFRTHTGFGVDRGRGRCWMAPLVYKERAASLGQTATP